MKNDTSHNSILKEVSFSLISEGKSLRIRADGYSMYPAIRPGTTVVIDPAGNPENLRIGDIIAYRRDSDFVLHRLTGIRQTGNNTLFITRGDSSMNEDKPITADKISGVVTTIETRKGTITPTPHRIRYRRNHQIVSLLRYYNKLIRLIR